MRRLEHCNIVKLKYFFYSSGEKVSAYSDGGVLGMVVVVPHRQMDTTLGFDLRFNDLVALSSTRTLSYHFREFRLI